MSHRSPTAEHRCGRCLTGQDVEVLVHVAAGKARNEVAAALHISPGTVAYHLTRMNRIFEVRSQAALVAAALVSGVLTSDRWPVLATTVTCIAGLFDTTA